MFNHLIFDLDNNLYNYSLCNNKALKKIDEYIFNTYNIDLINIEKSFNEIKKKYHNTVFHQASSHSRQEE